MSWKYFARTKAAQKIDAGVAANLLLNPIISEKSTMLAVNNQYIFNVRTDATKGAIKSAVEQLFKVKVVSVQTLRQEGKTKRFRGRLGTRPERKKAIVRLAPNSSIDLGSQV